MKTLDKSRTCVLNEHNSKTQGHYNANINVMETYNPTFFLCQHLNEQINEFVVSLFFVIRRNYM
jgi:hypothetical protein